MRNYEYRILHSLESASIMLTRDIKAMKKAEKIPINLDFHIDCIKADLNEALDEYNKE